MGRFSKHDAEAKGWIIVHEREAREVPTAAGETRTIPASYRAEKYVNDTLQNEEAETMGLLLERISLKEAQLDAANVVQRPVVIESDVPLDEAGIEQRTVIVPADPDDPESGVLKISDAELTSRSRGDAILQHNEEGDPEMVRFGPTEDALQADDLAERASTHFEEERTNQEPVDSEQIQVDPSGNVDSPGQSGPSTLIVREGESLGELAIRREEESSEAEQERVLADMERQKGYVENVPEPVDLGVLDANQARALAEEAEAKRLRDEEGEKAEHSKAVTTAGGEAEQKLADEQASEAPDSTPEAETPSEEDSAPDQVDLSAEPNASANEPDHTVGQQKESEVQNDSSADEEPQVSAGVDEQLPEGKSGPAEPATEPPQDE